MQDEKPLMAAQGHGGSLELYPNIVRIKRTGFTSLILQGLKDDTDIYINQISSIQLKRPGMMTNGYIQFTFLGGQESKKGLFDATKDENTLTFSTKQMWNIEAIKQAIEQKLFSSKNEPAMSSSYLGELEKLADLKTKGIITESEFSQKKKQILGL